MENDSARKIAEEITRQVHLKATHVLEIGCGDGRVSSLLIGHVGALTAIDPDREGIRKASRAIPEGVFRVGSGEDLEYPDGTFDLAVFTLSLHHQDSAAALREAARVVRAGGEVVVVEPVIGGEIEMVYSIVHDEDQAKREAQRAVAESGLHLLRERMFCAEWRFRDADDIYRTVFGYYDVPFDRKRADRIDTLLGPKLGDRPIVLEDRMVIQVLAAD